MPRRNPSSLRASRPWALATLRASLCLSLLATLLATPSCDAPEGPPRTVDVVARDLVAAEEEPEVLREHPEHPPVVEPLCPSLDPARDGVDRLALVLPPPAEVAFTVGDEGPAVLRASSGLGHLVHRELPESMERATVRLEVRVNDELVFAHEEAVERAPRPEGYEWRAVAGDGGAALEVRRGDRVSFRSTCRVDGAEVVPETRLAVGFGEPALVHPTPVSGGPATPERPNLVLVLQDTLRRDRLGVYGHDRPTSPRLDELAARGTTFDAAYATSSWTWPSTASVLTGMQPAQHGVLSEASCQLAFGLDVLPEVLLRAGYRTAGFSGSRIIIPALGFAQGFERFDSFRGQFRKSDALVPPALEWMTEHADERFFVYLHLVDTHAPHTPRAEDLAAIGGTEPEDWDPALFQEYTRRLGRGEGRRDDGTLDPSLVVPDAHRQWLQDVYDASVRTGDHWLGVVTGHLESLGLADRTVVAFTSDHGEELFDHGKLEHGHTLFGELVLVPLVLAGPGVGAGVGAGERVATPVSTRHLAPTLARLAGVDLPGAPDALDLLGDVAPRPVLLSTDHGVWRDGPRRTHYGLRQDDWVLHFAPDVDGGAVRLYDLAADPAEQRDLATEHPDRAAELRAAIERTRDLLETLRADPGRAADAATLQTLGEIGYLGE